MRFGASGAQPRWTLVGAGLVVVVLTYLYLILVGASGVGQEGQTATAGGNALIALLGYFIGAGLIILGVAGQFTTSTYALIPLAIAINIVVGEIVPLLRLPVYLDSIGTVLVAVLVGPWAGAATGGLTNIIWGLFRPVPLPFAVVALAIGLLAGVFARLGWFRRWYLVPLAGLITGVVAALLSAPLSAFIFGGVTGGGTDALVALFRAGGASPLASSLQQGLISDPIDKLVSFVIVYLIIVALPPRIRARFGQSNVVDAPR
jgi:energy-coupling factor transport system substrate-specific component